MNTYSCEPCMKFFNGIRPYESHLVSEKHKKKVTAPTSIVQDLKNCNFNSSNWEQEPFIICLENNYKCTLCKTSLNSVDQVRSHINGSKHLKANASVGLFTSSNVSSSSNQNIDRVDGNSSSALIGYFGFQLPMHIDEMQGLVEDITMFKPDDEIVFS